MKKTTGFFRTTLIKGMLAFCGWTFTFSDASATIFYVDPVNGNMSNNGSFNAPWHTLQEVFAMQLFETQGYSPLPYTVNSVLVIKNAGAPVKAGDTLMLRTGNHGIIDYTEAYNSDYITVMPQAGHLPVIKVMYLQAVSKWRFKGLRFSAIRPDGYYSMFTLQNGWHGPSYDNIIEDCFLYSIENASTWTAQQWNTLTCNCIDVYGDYTQVKNNVCQNVNYGIGVGANNVLVSHNQVINFVGDASRGNGHDLVFEYNIFKNLYKVNDDHNDGFQSWSEGGAPRERVTIRGNIIINYEDANQPFLGPLEGIGCFGGPYIDWVIENNIIAVDSYHGISILGLFDSKVVNNTVVDLDLSNGETANIFIDDYLPHNAISENVLLRNNISPIVSTPSQGAATFVVDHNFTDTANYEDLFADFQNRDFHPANDTVAYIDAGSSTEAPSIDLDENPRPMGNGFDIGAYEHPCGITNITAGTPSACDNNTYTVDVTLTYSIPPNSGNLVVKGQSFPIGASPQTVTLAGLVANGLGTDIPAFFSAFPICALTANNLFNAPAPCGGNCPAILSVNGNVASGTYQASMNLISDGTVQNGSAVVFKTGVGISLQNNFSVALGGDFECLIQSCLPEFKR